MKLASTNTGRLLLGVCSGLSNATKVDVGLLRIAFIIAVVFFGFGVGLYLILWLLMLVTGGYDD